MFSAENFLVEFGVLGLGCCDDGRVLSLGSCDDGRGFCRVLFRFGCRVAGLLRLEEALPFFFERFGPAVLATLKTLGMAATLLNLVQGVKLHSLAWGSW